MSNKYVLIVGASSGMGCEVIREMADNDTIFLAHYFSNKESLDALQLEISSKIIPIGANLDSEAGIDRLIDLIALKCDCPGKIIFIAAPGLTLTRFKDLEWGYFKMQMDMQLLTAFKVLQRFLPPMAQSKQGRIVFMLSSYTQGVPPSAMAHYVTAKYAMLGLMKSLSAEYASKNICINAVSPSMVETNFISTIPEKVVEFAAQKHPQKRNGKPADIAPVVKFLLSDEARFITGENIFVTGGV